MRKFGAATLAVLVMGANVRGVRLGPGPRCVLGLLGARPGRLGMVVWQ